MGAVFAGRHSCRCASVSSTRVDGWLSTQDAPLHSLSWPLPDDFTVYKCTMPLRRSSARTSRTGAQSPTTGFAPSLTAVALPTSVLAAETPISGSQQTGGQLASDKRSARKLGLQECEADVGLAGTHVLTEPPGGAKDPCLRHAGAMALCQHDHSRRAGVRR